MAKHSEQDEIAEALADMPKWRAKTARSFLGYAVLIALLAVLLLFQTWSFRDKSARRFMRRPIQTVVSLGGTVFAVGVSVYSVVLLLSARSSMLQHDERMAKSHPARRTPKT